MLVCQQSFDLVFGSPSHIDFVHGRAEFDASCKFPRVREGCKRDDDLKKRHIEGSLRGLISARRPRTPCDPGPRPRQDSIRYQVECSVEYFPAKIPAKTADEEPDDYDR